MGESEGMSEGKEVTWCYMNPRKSRGKVFSKTKTTFRGRYMTTNFGKDRRLCKIEANAIIYSN